MNPDDEQFTVTMQAGLRAGFQHWLASFGWTMGKLPGFDEWITTPGDELAIGWTCPDCRMTSHSLHDIRNQYCGNCHTFPEVRVRATARVDPPECRCTRWGGAPVHRRKSDCP